MERVSAKTVLLTARLLHDFRDVRPGCASVGLGMFPDMRNPFYPSFGSIWRVDRHNQISCRILVARKRWNKSLVWWLWPVFPPCIKLPTPLRFVFSVRLLQQKCERRNDGGNVGNTLYCCQRCKFHQRGRNCKTLPTNKLISYWSSFYLSCVFNIRVRDTRVIFEILQFFR